MWVVVEFYMGKSSKTLFRDKERAAKLWKKIQNKGGKALLKLQR